MGSTDSQIQKGREALIYFHNEATKFDGYNLKFNELLNKVSRNHPSEFLEGLGLAIELINEDGFFATGSRVKAAMINLADAGQGKVPGNGLAAFTKALSDNAQNISWVDATQFVAVETAKDVAQGVQAVGNTVIETAKSLNVILPLVIVGAVVFFVVSKTKKLSA